MSDCIFCKIVGGEIPAPKLYEDDRFIAIRDIRPQAKTHLAGAAQRARGVAG